MNLTKTYPDGSTLGPKEFGIAVGAGALVATAFAGVLILKESKFVRKINKKIHRTFE